MNKLISIIIPCKNGSNYLAEALEGIKKQNMNVEIIVVDDASTDNTVEIAKSYDCIVIQHEVSKGQVVAKNSALEVAKGDYILFHDHDDIMNEGALQKLYNEFEKDFSLQVVMAKLKDFISPELSDEEKKILVPRLEHYGGLLTGAMLFKREVLDIVGGFDEKLKTGETVDFLMRVENQQIKILKLEFISVMRRLHSTNLGRTMQQQERKDYATVLRAKLRRK